MFKKIGNWFDKHPVLGKVIIYAGSYAAFLGFVALLCKISYWTHPESTWPSKDDFELYEGELGDNFQKVKEFLETIKMVPGEGYCIEADEFGNKIFTQMFNWDEIAVTDI